MPDPPKGKKKKKEPPVIIPDDFKELKSLQDRVNLVISEFKP